ncbi:MAG: 5-histidylcysteine sulfoxide synthase [Candidatus Melainabacteria bacterium]|nr:5-histidylcysteine sulfoxide synthase [Candidatus Melainabacteria bacterium]
MNSKTSCAGTECLEKLPEPQILDDGWRQNLGTSNLRKLRENGWWTGQKPAHQSCPGVQEDGTVSSLVIPDLATCTRQEVQEYFDNSWTITEVLFSALRNDEAFYRPPYHHLRHPLIFYYGHPAALYINKLRVAGLVDSSINWSIESIFETGVDEMSWDDMSKNSIKWPTIDAVHEFRKQVYGTVCDVIAQHPDLGDEHRVIEQAHPLWALFMGFEHERIHIETSSVLIRELPISLVETPAHWPLMHQSARGHEVVSPVVGEDYPAIELISFKAVDVEYGKPVDFPTFGWDNEYGNKKVAVAEFEADRCLISNGSFFEFVKAGGYRDKKYWSEAGWNWRGFRNVKFPTFWVPNGPAGSDLYNLRTNFEIIPMPWSWPAVVNYHEASAFCKWRSEVDGTQSSYRLISEAEHESMRKHTGFSNTENPTSQSNLNLRCGSESPVDGNVSERSSGDVSKPAIGEGSRTSIGAVAKPAIGDLFGNVWQWCEDDFNPLPGFRIHPLYDDFSTPCFDGEHKMILGGSFVSTGGEASPWARFHFRPHFAQHAGFRLAYSADDNDGRAVKIGVSTDNPYETDRMLSDYLLLHFGDSNIQMPFKSGPSEATLFPTRCADLVTNWAEKLNLECDRVLDIGCAVGGASFHLAEKFDHVTAIDLSQSFINLANKLKTEGEVAYNVFEEGEIVSAHKATVDETQRSRVNFRRADACSLPPEFIDFDAVLIANVLCRLPSPMSLLNRLSGDRGVVKRGGVVVITTPFTWMETYTPRDVWMGGYTDENGNPHFSADKLKSALNPEFELLEEFDMPLIIREHRRKYQLIYSLATVWKRK